MRKLRVINSRQSADKAAGEIMTDDTGTWTDVRNGDPSTRPRKAHARHRSGRTV